MMKRLTICIMVLMSCWLAETVAAEQSFQDRCQAAGVVYCHGFDAEKEVLDYRSPGTGQNSTTPQWDTSTTYSGAGALKFELRGKSTANAAGQWRRPFGQNFAEQSTFYLTYRLRYTPEMLSGPLMTTSAGMKQHILSNTAATCNNVEITMMHIFGRKGPSMYSRCGTDPFRLYHETKVASYWQQWTPDYDGSTGTWDIANGWNRMTGVTKGPIGCHYGQGYNEPECVYFKANQWMTFYFEVHIGNWGAPNSSVKAWIAYEGQSLQQFIDLRQHIFRTGGSATSYNDLTLHTYMTSKNQDIAHPTGYAWYDELIVSSQPIMPGLGEPEEPTVDNIPPSSPVDLLVTVP